MRTKWQKKRHGKTRAWIRRRSSKGCYNNIVKELMIEDTAGYKEMMQMNHDNFSKILGMIEPYITPKDILGATEVIKAPERLVLTIRFLATEETYHSLSFQFRISVFTITYIVKEVCRAIRKQIIPQYVKTPSSVEEWLRLPTFLKKGGTFQIVLGLQMASML